MGGKLLVWGDELFLLRYALGQLTVQHVDVDGDEKKVALQPCSVSLGAELPPDARLVAAKQVEDALLATCYPVLVFQCKQEAAKAAEHRPPSGKRRRPNENVDTTPPDSAPLESSKTCGRLVFCVLCEVKDAEKRELCVRLLNELTVPTGGGTGGGVNATGSRAHTLQVFLTDGPYAVLVEKYSRIATVLKLHRAKRGHSNGAFVVWREHLDVANGVQGDTSVNAEVLSCVYVSERHSNNPHILVHAQLSDSSNDGKRNVWSTLYADKPQTEVAVTNCAYVPSFSCVGMDNSKPSSVEQVTCCCFISESMELDIFTPFTGETTTFPSWVQETTAFWPLHPDLDVSTLIVIGTSRNAVSAYTNGVLLASVVVPAKPIEIWCMCEDTVDQRYILGVRCANVNRSFFMLSFSSSVQHPSMEILLSFNHVGHALVGEFSRANSTGTSTPDQVLLLNDVPGIVDAGTEDYCIDEKPLDDNQLVTRSVLVAQKLAVPEAKLSCHRLRLREESKNKSGAHSRKRPRKDKEAIGDSDLKSQTFHYIDRTQKASSSRDKEMDDTADSSHGGAASDAQLSKLADSLAVRLDSGLKEMERLQWIVNDKYLLSRGLDQIVVRRWQRQQQARSIIGEQSLVVSLAPTSEIDDAALPNQNLVGMETIVFSPSRMSEAQNAIDNNNIDSGVVKQMPASPLNDLLMEPQVSLEEFRVTGYVPSSSLVRAEVVLINKSAIVLRDSFVVVTAPRGGHANTRGWMCSSSVVTAFIPAKDKTSRTTGKVRFHLELRFAPTFTFLRMRHSLEATLWLHWNSSGDDSASLTTVDWQPSASALAVSSVKFVPEDFVQFCGESPPNNVIGYPGRNSSIQSERQHLLVLSSGSCLTAWARNQYQIGSQTVGRSLGQHLQPIVVRPTFALLTLEVTEREMMLYELSRMIASLPSDVYVMHNPFQRAYLSTLQRVLRAMRSEILHIAQQQSSSLTGKASTNGNYGVQAKQKKQASDVVHQSAASAHRWMQRDTDLQVHCLLQLLQKRTNFHMMWFDASTAEAYNPT